MSHAERVWAEAIVDEIMAENFSKLLADINAQIHKTQQTPYGIKIKPKQSQIADNQGNS